MHYPALVLNADYTPVSVYPLSTWSFDRTLRNLMKDRIVPLAHYDAELRSPSITYKPPSVVALKQYIKRPNKVAFNRYNIFLRDDFTCQYCGNKHDSSELTFDHVIPRLHGGKTNFENITTSCVSCNTRKGSDKSIRPKNMPYVPTERELAKAKTKAANNTNSFSNLHHTWYDYLYWSGVLEQK